MGRKKITEVSPRHQAIIDAYLGIGTPPQGFAEIARAFGVTRQRIEQVVKHHTGNVRSFTKRSADFLDPYIKAMETSDNRCLTCRKPLIPESATKTVKTTALRNLICDDCSKTVTLIRTIKSRIRAAKSNQRNEKMYYNYAAYLIRKHNIQPEDLNLV